MWTRKDLREIVDKKLKDYKLIVTSNREPYIHILEKGKITCRKGPGGVVTALDPVMRACGGTWVSVGAGDADRRVVDKHNKVQVPPHDPQYTLKVTWLTKEENHGYYYGFSNEALWPLCHMVYTRPQFHEEDWQYYCKVNEKFAQAILEEVGKHKAFVWIQDYHLALLPKYLKKASPNIITAHFWHIPWPNPDTFRICPKKTEILEGLLANDLLGFHIRHHCDNFIQSVDRELEAKIDREKFSITRAGHETLIRPFPISVDYQGIEEMAASDPVKQRMEEFKEEFGLKDKTVLLGLDRIDYTKGLIDKLKALDRFMEKYPQYKGKFVFFQVGQLSRVHIEQYKRLNDQMNNLIEEINWKHSTDDWSPLKLVRKYSAYEEVLAFYGLSDVCIVSSLDDGMNLVCKEFISAKSNTDGVLILSKFTGAARELPDALLVNPFDTEEFADQIKKAIEMKPEQRKRRMKKMRSVVKTNNIYRWAGKMLSELLRFEFKE